jgi:hypothetical protein
MIHKLLLSLGILCQLKNAWAYTASIEDYVSRVKKSNPVSEQAKIFSKRIALDLENNATISEISFACAENIFKISPAQFRIQLQIIVERLKIMKKTASEKEKAMSSFFGLTRTTSLEEIYPVYAQSLLEIFPELLSEFFPLLIKNKKTHLFLTSFDKNKNSFLSNEKIKIPALKFYCLSATLNGVVERCLLNLKAADPSFKDPWQQIAAIGAYISENRITEAKRLLIGFLGEKLACPQLKGNPWVNYFTALLHRLEGDYARSISCLEAFKISDELTEDDLFFYNLESAKSNYKINLEKSKNYLNLCDEYISKHDLNNTYFSLILKIEKIKYQHLKKETKQAKKLLAEALSEIEENSLAPYLYTLKQYNKITVNNETQWKDDVKCSSYFECLDFQKTVF